jgi:uncharacterized membrane protein YhaH (DUF805 family)
MAPTKSLRSLLFGLEQRVDRKSYLVAGVALMGLKYALDAGAIYVATGELLDPLRFISPLWTTRAPEVSVSFSAAWNVDVALAAMAGWALLFMWVGLSMSIRRAVDAGASGWWGLTFMLPLINLPFMLLLASLPSSETAEWSTPVVGPYRATGEQPRIAAPVPAGLKSALLGTLIGIAVGLGMGAMSVHVLGSYGSVLFFFTPFAMGASAAYLFNHDEARSMGATIAAAATTVIVCGLAMILIAFEGAVCIAMAAPIAAAVACVGAVVGRALAAQRGATKLHAALMVLALPAVAGAEAKLRPAPVYEVVSWIEVDAPPEEVWPNVIGFSELPPPRRLLFDTGIAYPMRARIEGEGVGAVRHCEFSTGPFVEPITRWEPPRRLSFDVSSQPPAMKEWSPYADVYPPHLDHSVRSLRGEFRLVALPGGRTRLEGSTWYALEMAPSDYWRFWSDLMIHAIHQRVLDHVKHLSEAP